MKKLAIILIIDIIFIKFVISQTGVSINTNGTPADNSAILDISSTNRGLLIPRMITVQRNNINLPAQSLLIFNTTTNCYEAYVNGQWYSISCPPPCSPPSAPVSGTNTATQIQITWNWSTVTGATGYKFSTSNNYANASENGISSTYIETSLLCNTSYTLYIWAYNNCGNSTSSALMQTTLLCTPGPNCNGQEWASTNLNTGTWISQSVNQVTNQKWCYNDLQSNCDIYGGIYQWAIAMLNATGVDCDPCSPTSSPVGVQGMCPTEYHIPSDLELSRYEYCIENNISPTGNTLLSTFQTIQGYRGSTTPGVGPGDKMKVNGSNNPPWDGTNTSGFSALPTGLINDGSSAYIGTETLYWTSTGGGISAFAHEIDSGHHDVYRAGNLTTTVGHQVRCLKD